MASRADRSFSFRRIRAVASTGLVVALAGASIATVMLVPQWSAKLNQALAREGTGGAYVTEIELVGSNRIGQEELQRALGVTEGSALAELDLDVAKEQVEKIGWVKKARIERHLSGLVRVAVEERKPYAVWQLGGRYHLVDGDGVVLEQNIARAPKGMPLVVGPGAGESVRATSEFMALAPKLGTHVVAWIRVAGRRWNVMFDTDQQLALPEDKEAQAAWKLFAQLDQQHQLLARDVTIFDMRVPGRFVTRLAPNSKSGVEKKPHST